MRRGEYSIDWAATQVLWRQDQGRPLGEASPMETPLDNPP